MGSTSIMLQGDEICAIPPMYKATETMAKQSDAPKSRNENLVHMTSFGKRSARSVFEDEDEPEKGLKIQASEGGLARSRSGLGTPLAHTDFAGERDASLCLKSVSVGLGSLETSVMCCSTFREYIISAIIEDTRMGLLREFTVSLRYSLARELLVDDLRALAGKLGLSGDVEAIIAAEFPRKHFGPRSRASASDFGEARARALEVFVSKLVLRLAEISREGETARAAAADDLLVWIVEALFQVPLENMMLSMQRLSELYA